MDGFKGLVDMSCGDPHGIQACLADSGTLTAELYRPGARDQRLRLYRQGRWADAAAGSGWLALQTGDVSRPEVLGRATDDEVLGIGRTWKTLETWTFVQKLAIVRELIRRHAVNSGGGPATAAGGLPEEWDPRLHHEIAAALGISAVGAGKLAHLAWVLDAQLPGIGEALRDNRLDPPRARLIVEETSVLEDEALFSAAEAIILAGLPHCPTWSALRRLVQRAVITVDPEGAQKRRKQAEREHARVTFWRENCGTCGLQATGLPTDEALAANASIEARARLYKDAGITRPMDILRVMAFADLINGVTVAQRAVWAKADDAARQAGDDKEQARVKARAKAPKGHAPDQGRPPGGGSPGDGDGPSDGGGPDGDGPGGPDDRAPDGGDQDGPGEGGPCGSGPDADDPRGYAPGRAGPDGGPGDDGAGGAVGDAPGGGSQADDSPGAFRIPGTNGADGSSPDSPACPGCGSASSGIGLPVRASLTVPAGALEWLAEWSAQARAPAGSGSGGGSPGRRYRGGPGPCPQCGNQGSGGMPVREHLVFPLLTLVGLAERPGEAHGLGALDPGLVRDLAAAGARHPGSQFCVTVTDEDGFAIGHGCLRLMRGKKGRAIPVDPGIPTITPSGRAGPRDGHGSWIVTLPGAPLAFIADIHPVPTYDCDHRLESRAYQPGERLRHLVQVRDGKCSFPACSRQARESDFEHAEPFQQGGRTCACNAHACSRSCHRAKQSRGWRVTKPRPGWTQWTTRAGRTYLQGPWRYPALDGGGEVGVDPHLGQHDVH